MVESIPPPGGAPPCAASGLGGDATQFSPSKRDRCCAASHPLAKHPSDRFACPLRPLRRNQSLPRQRPWAAELHTDCRNYRNDFPLPRSASLLTVMSIGHKTNLVLGHGVEENISIVRIARHNLFVERPFVVRIFRVAHVPVVLLYVDFVLSSISIRHDSS